MKGLPGCLVLIGHPVAHSLSPAFQNAALRHRHVPLEYRALDVRPAALERTLEQLLRQRAAGNVTLPHKQRLAALCRRLTPAAQRAGAVNTFWTSDDDALVGDNTDVAGFAHMASLLLSGVGPALLGGVGPGLRIGLLGAGGGAAAVCAATEGWHGMSVALWSRSGERAVRLAARFPGHTRATRSAAEAVAGAHLVVNATPVGLDGVALPLDPALLPEGAAVADLVYRRGETAWVLAARARGHRALDGLSMLLEQGALAFERWTGLSAPRDVMRRALA